MTKTGTDPNHLVIAKYAITLLHYGNKKSNFWKYPLSQIFSYLYYLVMMYTV